MYARDHFRHHRRELLDREHHLVSRPTGWWFRIFLLSTDLLAIIEPTE